MHRFFLRDATHDLHADLDARISVLDLSDAEDYAGFLLIQAGALLPLEHALEAGGVEASFGTWPRHRRSAALRSDLQNAGLPEPAVQPVDAIADPAVQMGILYVLEGSRLGGRLLERRAGDQAPKAFLHHGLGQPLWQDFLVHLESLGDTQCVRDGLVAGARLAFATYQASTDRMLDGLQRSGHASVQGSSS